MSISYRHSKLLRRSRVFWGSLALWRPRLVFWCGALDIGVISVGFAKLAELGQTAFGRATSWGEWAFLLPLVLTPLGMLSAYIAATLFPNSQASGIPQAIAARHLRDE
jgi:H+/Cl- antiporter ClcA